MSELCSAYWSRRWGGFGAVGLLVVLSSSGVSAWTATIDGAGVDDVFGDFASVVATDASGDVFAGGGLTEDTNRDFGIVKLDGVSGAEFWRTTVGSTSTSTAAVDTLQDLAVDSLGDVIVCGRLGNGTISNSSNFAVVKLSGVDGSEIWRFELAGTDTTRSHFAVALAVDSSGNIIATGAVSNLSTGLDLAAVKLSGVDGSPMWTTEIQGTKVVGGRDQATSLALDSSGNAVVGAQIHNTGSLDFAVVKFSALDGSELWRVSIDGTLSNLETAADVAVDGNDDVVAVGFLRNATPGFDDFTTVKLLGSTGGEVWRSSVDLGFSDQAQAVALDASGNPIVTGKVDDPVTGDDLYVTKLSATDGTAIWSTSRSLGADDRESGSGVAVDASGDVVVVGSLIDGSAIEYYTVLKLAGSDGSELWSLVRPNGGAFAVTIGVQGEVLTAGSFFDGIGVGDMAILSQDSFDGTTQSQLVSGKRLIAVDRVGDAGLHRLVSIYRDTSLTTPLPGSADDPTIVGAVFSLINAATGESTSVDLPAQFWSAIGTGANARGYRYRDPSGAGGPCPKALVRDGRIARVACVGKLGLIDFTLDESAQGSLSSRLRFGTDLAVCTDFGGSVQRDVGTDQARVGRFKAKDAPAPARCPVP